MSFRRAATIPLMCLLASGGCLLPSFEKVEEEPAPDAGPEQAPLPGQACGLSDQLPRSCDACIREECCELAEACPEGSACGKDLLKDLHPAQTVSEEFDPLLACLQGKCDAQCEINWGCVDSYSVPAAKESSSFEVTLVDFASNSLTVDEVTVKACRGVDPGCTSGKVSEGVSVDGKVTLDVPSDFDGYFSFDGGDLGGIPYVSSTAQWSEPIFRLTDWKHFLISEGSLRALALVTEHHSSEDDAFDPSRGHLIFRIQGCLPMRFLGTPVLPRAEVADIQVVAAPSDGASKLFYTENAGNVSLTLEQTSNDGVGGGFDFPARNVSVTAKRADGREVARGSVRLKAGAIGYVYLRPNSLR